MKKIIQFLGFFLPWFVSILLIQNHFSFYDTIHLPSFAPNISVLKVVWTIVYFGIAIALYQVHRAYHIFALKEYSRTILFNYLCNLLYSILLFRCHNLFLSFVCSVAVTISAFIIYYETKDLQKNRLFLFFLIYFSLFLLRF